MSLQVNHYDLLHVRFDWARQLETYQRASNGGQVLLQIIYNDNFQPMIINASGTDVLEASHTYRAAASRRALPIQSSDPYATARPVKPFPLSLSYAR